MKSNFFQTLLFAINKPPLLIHPGFIPVSSSMLFTKWFMWLRSWISVSLGRSLQTNPAVCHVVPNRNRMVVKQYIAFSNLLWKYAQILLIVLLQDLYFSYRRWVYLFLAGQYLWRPTWPNDTKFDNQGFRHLLSIQ